MQWEWCRVICGAIQDQQLPYLKDLLRSALDQSSPDDIIMWTNDDVWIHPAIVEELMFKVPVYDAVSSHRCEMESVSAYPKIHYPPSVFAERRFTGRNARPIGRDMFAFTSRQLEKWFDEIPDFILGASEFDYCLAQMIRRHHQTEWNHQNIGNVIFPSELEIGYICHTAHAAFWMNSNNINSAPSQIHNRTLYSKWKESNP
jgi:hypothetical protein